MRASDALSELSLDEISSYRAPEQSPETSLPAFGKVTVGAGGEMITEYPTTIVSGESVPEWIDPFANNVLRPMMAGAAAVGAFATEHGTLATTGMQLALLGPAKLVQSTVATD